MLDDMTIAYGDIRSPGTRRNLMMQPAAEVVFVDPFVRKGVRVRGSTEVVETETIRFETLIQLWRDTWGDLAKRIQAIVMIHVDRVLPLSTPPYDDGAGEADMIALYQEKYAAIYPRGDS